MLIDQARTHTCLLSISARTAHPGPPLRSGSCTNLEVALTSFAELAIALVMPMAWLWRFPSIPFQHLVAFILPRACLQHKELFAYARPNIFMSAIALVSK